MKTSEYIVFLLTIGTMWADIVRRIEGKVSRTECRAKRGEGEGKLKKILMPFTVIGMVLAGMLISAVAFGSDLSDKIGSGQIGPDMITLAIGGLITLVINVLTRIIPTKTAEQAETRDKILNGLEALTRAILPGIVSMIVPNRTQKKSP